MRQHAAVGIDPETGEVLRVYPRWKRALKYACTVPFVLAWVLGWRESLPALVIEGQSLTFLKHAGEGVLVELVQAPPEVVKAFAALAATAATAAQPLR